MGPGAPIPAWTARQGHSPTHKQVATPAHIKALSGSIAGVVEACCLQPIDSIKTRLQLDRSGHYKGILSCGKSIILQEGVGALWKGLTPYAAHLTLKHTLRMGSNALLQSALRDAKTGEISHSGRLAAGFGAGVFEALLVVTPFEVVKTRLQQQRGVASQLLKYKGPLHCASLIIHEEGIRGLWAGATPTVMRNGVNQGVMFSAKNRLDMILWDRQEGDGCALHPWQSMASGFLTGLIGPVFSAPFDVIKTRLMAQDRCRKFLGEVQYKSMLHAMRRIYREEGLCTLWKGLLPRLLKIPPGQAILWTVADQISRLYDKKLI